MVKWHAGLDFSQRLFAAFVGFSLVLLLLHGTVYVISPLESPYPTRYVWLSYLIFVAVFSAVFLATHRLWKKSAATDQLAPLANRLVDSNLLHTLLILAIVGVISHMYAKFYITQIRPIDCLFEIRFAWLEVSHQSLPTHVRVASVLGHLLSSFCYAGIFLTSWFLVTRPAKISQKLLAIYLAVFMLLGCLYAGFIGSRNIMLAYVILNLCAVLIGSCSTAFTVKRMARGVLVLALPSMVGLGFSALVFSDRILCGGTSRPTAERVEQYVSGYLNELPVQWRNQAAPGQVKSAAPQGPSSLLDQIRMVVQTRCTSCVATFVYINHGVFNFAQITSVPERGTPILLNFVHAWSSRFGIDWFEEKRPPKRVYGAGGIGLAGAAYHDFGWTGVLMVGLFFGLALSSALALIQAGGRFKTAFGMTLLVCCFYTLALSYMFIAPNVIAFPFIALAMFLSLYVLPLWRPGKNNAPTAP